MSKRMILVVFIATAAFAASGHAALACNTVTASITDASTLGEYAHGGVLMIIDHGNFAQPIAGSNVQLSGGHFTVTVPGNIGAGKAIVSLFRPAGEAKLPPLTYDVNMTGTPGLCLAIEDEVDTVIYTSLARPGAVAF